MAPHEDSRLNLLPRNLPLSPDVHLESNRDGDTISARSEHGRVDEYFDWNSTHEGGIAAKPHKGGNTQLTKRPKLSRLLLKLISFWVGTLCFTSLVVAVVTIYRAKGVLTPAQKDFFNLILTVLILLLGLTFFEAFKELAKVLPKKIKPLSGRSMKEDKLIKNFESLLNVARLLCVTPRWWLRLICLLWLSINLAAQMLNALISLEVSIDDGNDYTTTYKRPGNVSVSDLSCYDRDGSCPVLVTRHTLAHSYGETIRSYQCSNYSEIADVASSESDIRYFCRNDGLGFAYQFKEFNPMDRHKAYPYFTNRTIEASSGVCYEYDQAGEGVPDMIGDISARNFTYKNEDGSINGSLSIPTANLGQEGTTYIYRGHNPPETDSLIACGPRCLWMWAYRDSGGNKTRKFYQCSVTMSIVTNASQESHQVPDSVAREAVASIALEGEYQGNASNPDYTQYQFYPRGSPWQIHSDDVSQVGAIIAKFALGSLAEMVDRNPPIYINGTVPYLGSRLSVKKGPFIAILVCIVATHFVVLALTYLLVRGYI